MVAKNKLTENEGNMLPSGFTKRFLLLADKLLEAFKVKDDKIIYVPASLYSDDFAIIEYYGS